MLLSSQQGDPWWWSPSWSTLRTERNWTMLGSVPRDDFSSSCSNERHRLCLPLPVASRRSCPPPRTVSSQSFHDPTSYHTYTVHWGTPSRDGTMAWSALHGNEYGYRQCSVSRL